MSKLVKDFRYRLECVEKTAENEINTWVLHPSYVFRPHTIEVILDNDDSDCPETPKVNIGNLLKEFAFKRMRQDERGLNVFEYVEMTDGTCERDNDIRVCFGDARVSDVAMVGYLALRTEEAP